MNRGLTDHEYGATADLLAQLAGLVFDDSRRAALSAIMRDRLSITGTATVEEYLRFVESTAGSVERQELFDAVTIQETHFFRNVPQIEALRRHVIPELMKQAVARGRPLTIWSAGCSTGEEPYTVAMLVLEAMEGRLPMPARIIGTDVSAAALEVAESASYSGRTMQLAEQGAAERWFDVQRDGSYRVKQEIRQLVEFRLHNLVSDPAPFIAGEVDLVVCRNVTIYFAKETTRELVHRFHGTLGDGGYLLMGHAETLWQVSEAFSLVPVGEAFVYRKDTRAGPGAVRPGVGPRRTTPSPLRPTRSALPRPRSPRQPATVRRVATPRLAPPLQQRSVGDQRRGSVDTLLAAREALSAGLYTEAAELAARATEQDPMLAEAYVTQGRALANLGDDVGAAETLRKAVFLDPVAGHAHFLLGATLSRLGEIQAASLSFSAAADTLPDVPTERLVELLDGRAVGDLVDLCRQLAAAVVPSGGPATREPADEQPAGGRRR